MIKQRSKGNGRTEMKTGMRQDEKHPSEEVLKFLSRYQAHRRFTV